MSETDPVADAKKAARTYARAARCALDLDVCLAHAEQLAANLAEMPELTAARIVLAYNATPEEIDPASAVDLMRANGVTIAYPRIEAPGILGLHVVDHGATLLPGPFGLTEPAPDTPRIDPAEVDAVIVPGVAFDGRCWRLGYGGGYYDRLLPLLRNDCVLIGIAYDEQVLDEIPAVEHDVRLDAVVTPTRVIRCGS